MSMSSKERRALAKAVRRAPPPDLRRKLLAIPETMPKPARGGWRWLAAPAAVAAIAVTVATMLLLVPGPQTPERSAEDLAAEAAVRDFTVAMVYLRRSTEIAGRHTDDEIGQGMRDALAISRGALIESNTSNGG